MTFVYHCFDRIVWAVLHAVGARSRWSRTSLRSRALPKRFYRCGPRTTLFGLTHTRRITASREDESIEHFHGFNGDQPESAPDGLEELSFGSPFLADFTVERAAELLQLINQKRKHHEGKEGEAQVLLAEAEVVLEMVSLVFERVEGFSLDFPAGASAPHDVIDVVAGEGKSVTQQNCCGFLPPLSQYSRTLTRRSLLDSLRGTPLVNRRMAHTRIFFIREIVLYGLSRRHGGVYTAKEVKEKR